MKKILSLAIMLLLVSTLAYSQDTIVETTTRTVYSKWERNNLNLRIGPEVGLPMGDFKDTHNLGIGASALLNIPIARRFSVVAYAGFRTHGGKNEFNGATIYPLRAGINYKLTPD